MNDITKKSKPTIKIDTIIALCSLFISIMALNGVTKVEGFQNLLKKTEQNATKLQEVTSQLKQQNSLQQYTIDKNEVELKETKIQSLALLKLLESEKEQLRINKKYEKSYSNFDFFHLTILHNKLTQLESLISGNEIVDYKYKHETVEFLKYIKDLVRSGTENNFLMQYDNLFSNWWLFYQQIESTIFLITNMEEPYKFYNLKPIRKSYFNDKLISEEEAYKLTMKSFSKYYFNFLQKGVFPLLQIELIKKTRSDFLESSLYSTQKDPPEYWNKE